MQSELKSVPINSVSPFAVEFAIIGKNAYLETVRKNKKDLLKITSELKKHSIEAESLKEYQKAEQDLQSLIPKDLLDQEEGADFVTGVVNEASVFASRIRSQAKQAIQIKKVELEITDRSQIEHLKAVRPKF